MISPTVKKNIELVIPVHNEASVIEAHLKHILEASLAVEPRFRLTVLVIDDGSSDDTRQALERICQNDARVRYLSFTRNFGKEAAIQAGLENSGADAVIVLDSDLQHPPELIPHMAELWADGIKVVEACKIQRGRESPANRFFAAFFYRLFHLFSGLDLQGQSDYKLLDRTVIEQYKKLHEQGRFFRGIIQWMNYPTARLPFNVPERKGGTSSWSRLRLFRYALHNITSFSAAPLQLVSWFGVLCIVVGAFFGIVALVQKWQGQALDGFTTVIFLQIFFSGSLMLSLGVIGHYLARIYEEIKHRPAYLIDHVDDPGETGNQDHLQ